MNPSLQDLLARLELEPIEKNLYRGESEDLGWGRVYGGQILGQALAAAVRTVPAERPVHSLHAYFLLPGDVSLPVVYQVDRARDGGSFTTRRVTAIQRGEAILVLAASFQEAEESWSHQDAMPEAPDPESLEDDLERFRRQRDRLPAFIVEHLTTPGPFEVRSVDPIDDPVAPTPGPAEAMMWLRARGDLPDDDALHRTLLAYASDANFLTTALRPHGVTWLSGEVMLASLDHAMWFHRPFRLDEWLLYAIDGPAAGGARGLVRGRIFNQAGELVVSTAQEGLVRRRKKR